ncbi:UBX domain-containing protein 7 isoform X2 [Oratosquilla oratoria]
MALNMHMEGATGNSGAVANAEPNEEEVRAPIPQKQEVLVEGPDEIAYSFRGKRRSARSVFDRFRDFEAEAKRQEEELMSGGASTSTHSATDKKRRTLEDLFRPPIDLIFKGTFQGARDMGATSKKWLMVNIQDSSEFSCQVLNRDVWSNPTIKAIIREQFIFWQVYHDSEEGQRFMMFYQVPEWPYVSILDPRTGECLVTWHKLDTATFGDLVTEFLSVHPSFEEGGSSSPPKKKQRVERSASLLEADEEAQIEAAIQASLAEQDQKKAMTEASEDEEDEKEEGDSDTLETFDSDSNEADYSIENNSDRNHMQNGNSKIHRKSSNQPDKEEEEEKKEDDESVEKSSVDTKDDEVDNSDWKLYLGDEKDAESKLMLRLPDGSRDVIAMPSTSKLMALVKYVGSKGYSNERFELVTNFPRRQISYMDFNKTLKDVGLFPQETVFVQAR